MRKFQQLVATAGLVIVGVLGLQVAAGAATGYPGSTTTTVASGSIVVNLGNQPIGNTFTVTLCGFAPGATVTVAVNGTVDASVVAGSGGCVTLTGVVSDPHIAVNGGTPIAVPLGANAITATGTSAGGGTQTDTADLTVVTTAAAAASPSGLAFTGADIMAVVIGGLALIALGFLVLTFARRRTTAS